MYSGVTRSSRQQSTSRKAKSKIAVVRQAALRAAGQFIESLEQRQLLSIVAPSHIVVVVEEDRAANAIGDTTNMPYLNQLAAMGLVYSNSHGLNTTAQDGEMNYLALFSGSTQGETGDGFDGPYTGGNLSQSLYNKGLSFTGYAEAMPHNGDTTDAYGASPTNAAYDDLYIGAYNAVAQFSNVGTGKTNAQVNQTFAGFPTTAAGYAALPTVSYVIPDTADNTHGSNDTAPYATDPSEYNFFRKSADTWLKNNLSGYVQWAQQNNSILIITGDEGDRAHGFTSLATNNVSTIIVGAAGVVVPGVDPTSVNTYNLLRTIEDMYGLSALGSTSTATDLHTNAQGQLAAPSAQAATSTALTTSKSLAVYGQSVTFTATVTSTSTPTGTVTFTDGGTTLGTGTLNGSGVATFTTSTLPLGSQSITATYAGNTSFLTSTSPAVSQTVSKASTTTIVASNAVNSVFGQSISFKATVMPVSPGAGTPTGTIQFVVDGSNFGSPVTMAGGLALSASTSSLSVGTHSILAVYSSDLNFVASTAAALTQTVGQSTTLTSLTANPTASTFGQAILFTATVTVPLPGSGAPTGTVTFEDGSTPLGTGTLNAAGVATFTSSSLSITSHPITAVYGGDGNFVTSTSTAVNEVVSKASATTTVTSSVSPSVFGQSVTFTATEVPISPAAVMPTGTVTFLDGTTTLGTGTLNASGVATFVTSSLSVASHPITAAYAGDSTFLGNTSAVFTHVVGQASTSTSVVSSLSPSVFGQGVTFTATVGAIDPGSGAPTGTVTFKDGSTTLGTGTLNASGVATFTTVSLSVAAHSITVAYAGDTNFVASGSSAYLQTVGVASTTATVTSSAGPSTFGQSITFSTTVAPVLPGTGTPTGTAQFVIDGANFGAPVALINGMAASSAMSSLAAGGHLVAVVYSGDANFGAVTSSSISQAVSQTSTSTLLGSSANPSVFGQNVILTATVSATAPGGGTPTGIVTFSDGATTLGTGALDANGVATFSTTSLTLTSHPITAAYAGDANDLASGSATMNQVVNPVPNFGTTASVISSAGSSVFGQAVTFTAAIAPISQGSGTPTGTVQFTIDGANFGSPVSLVNGSATSASIGSLAIGGHSIAAIYNGDSTFTGSTSTAITQSVAQASTAVSLTASANPAVFGQSLLFTATVVASAPGAGTPSGSVTFMDGSTMLGTGTLTVAGIATFTTSSLSVAGHSITATYGGDTNFVGSGSTAISEAVNPASTSTSLVANLSPSVFGQGVTFTATVAPVLPGAGAPTGTVQFTVDGSNVGAPVSLTSGSATSSAIGSLAVGGHSIGAVYSGDTNFGVSTAPPITQSVGKASSTTSLVSSFPSAVFGQGVLLTATISVAAPGAGSPTGTVTFKDGSTTLGTGTLNGAGVATFTTSNLSAASHSLTASYGGDANFIGNASSAIAQTINAASTSTSLSSSTGSTVFGQGVTFTATVVPVAPGAGIPAGTVTFTDGATVLGTGTLNGSGVATFTSSSLAVTTHSVTASYAASTNFAASASSAASVTVGQASTATTLTSSANPSTAGQSVTFTATVVAVAPGSGIPTGTVTFKDGSTILGTGTLNGSGVATFATTTLTAASHSITAAYAASSNFVSSTSAALTQQVNTGVTAPANDNFANATVITGTSATLTGTNVNATKQTGEPSHGGNAGGKSVWYSWTAPSAGTVSIDTHGSSFDTLLGIYTGASVSALTTIASNDDDLAGGTTTSKVGFTVVAGTVYQIAVDGYGGASGSITLNLNFAAGGPTAPTGLTATAGTFSDGVHLAWTTVAGATAYEVWRSTTNNSANATKVSTADVTVSNYNDTTATPGTTYFYFVKAKNTAGTSGFSASASGFRAAVSNDNFANATVLTGTSITTTGTNTGASKQTGEPNHGGNAGGKSVWYVWTAPTSGTVSIDTHGSSFDTLLGVYTGTSVSSLTTVASNDDDPAGGTTTSKVTFAAKAGTVYYIAVDGYAGISGSITLHLTLT